MVGIYTQKKGTQVLAMAQTKQRLECIVCGIAITPQWLLSPFNVFPNLEIKRHKHHIHFPRVEPRRHRFCI